MLALLLATGLSATFLSPFRYAAPVAQAQPGRILGESIVVPLHITVVVQQPDHRWEVTTYPSSGTITEALAQAAGSAQGTLSYVSRGSSIYLQRFMGSANDTTGRWVTRVNGEALTDLSLRQLIQGDEVSIVWE